MQLSPTSAHAQIIAWRGTAVTPSLAVRCASIGRPVRRRTNPVHPVQADKFHALRVQHRQRLRSVSVTASSKRQAKDPRRHGSMDDMRTHLHQQTTGSGGLAGLLNWLSNSAFGAASQQTGKGLPSLARSYRWLLSTGWAKQLTSGLQLRPGYVPSQAEAPIKPSLAEFGSNTLDEERIHMLADLLLCSRSCVLRMARKCPEVLTRDPHEVTQRLMLLKGVFPSCNVARMLELLPEGFLLQSQQSMLKRVAAINLALRDGLPGANVDLMVQEDPTILFEDTSSVSSGLRELHDLWDIDETALSNSNPWELALAIRTMSDNGPSTSV